MKKSFLIIMLVSLFVLSACGKKDTVPIGNLNSTDSTKENQTENTETESSAETAVPDMEGALSTFQFAVNEQTYQLPVLLTDFLDKGWSVSEDEDTLVDAESTLENIILQYNDLSITCDIANFTTEVSNLKRCYISRVLFDMDANKGEDKIYLPGDIEIGKSTLVDVQSSYDEPRDQYEGKEYIIYTYEYGSDARATLTFLENSEELVTAELCDQNNPLSEDTEVESGDTDAVKAYIQPDELSSKPEDFIVSYDGDLYRLPAPVKAFLSNGWEIDEDSSDKELEANDYGYVTLNKDGQMIYTTVYNPELKKTLVENCFVTTLYSDLVTTKVPMKVLDGICLGMSKDDAKNAMADISFKKKKNKEDKTENWTIKTELGGYIKITIDQDLEIVSGIEAKIEEETSN